MPSDLLRWRREARAIDYALWDRLAAMVGTSPGYLNLIAYGYRSPSPRRAKKIEDATRQIRGVKPVKKESLVF
ncbi:helix-turn-helix transcriptional regulator [Escherichia coli]|nr:helix-turn-helix transcriptional regulator [Escherichia coli]